MVKTKNKKRAKTGLDKMKDQFPGAIHPLGWYKPEEVISTGSLALDLATGVGGVTAGRYCEVYGAESSGKTTLALMIIKEAQKTGRLAAFIDAEQTLEMKYAAAIGVDVSNMAYFRPEHGEDALTTLDKAIAVGAGVIVIDSVAALASRAEFEKEIGATHVAMQARLMSQALRRLTAAVKKNNAIVVFVNQMRVKISTTGFGGHGGKTVPGGEALKFYSSLMFDLRKGSGYIEDDTKKVDKYTKERLGQPVRIMIQKNKRNAPFKVAEFNLIYGKGIDVGMDILMTAIKVGAIREAGGGNYYLVTDKGEEKFEARGKDKVADFIYEHPGMAKDITIAVREHIIKESMK